MQNLLFLCLWFLILISPSFIFPKEDEWTQFQFILSGIIVFFSAPITGIIFICFKKVLLNIIYPTLKITKLTHPLENKLKSVNISSDTQTQKKFNRYKALSRRNF